MASRLSTALRRALADWIQVAGPQICSAALDLVELWSLKSHLAHGRAFTASKDIHHAALDTIWAATFGSTIGTTRSQIQLLRTLTDVEQPRDEELPASFPHAPTPAAFDAVMTLTNSVEYILSSPLPRLQHFFLRQLPSMRAAKNYKDTLIYESLEKAREEFSRSPDDLEPVKSVIGNFLRRELATAKKEERSPQYNTRASRDEIFGILIAGHETTATTITWGLKFLTDCQDVQQKLRRSLREAMLGPASRGANPSVEEIVQCSIPYLDATIEEILRCGNTAPTNMRVAKVDTELLGHVIPKGINVFFMSNGPGYKAAPMVVDETLRSKSSQEAKHKTGVWDASNVAVFMPERWLTPHEKGSLEFDSRAGPSIPFGLGPRGCFGKKLAYLELRIIIVLLIWNFEFQKAPANLSGYGARDKLTHQPQQCYVRLTPLKRI
ncbi:hypothetical protein B0A49_12712 [Cryomyces minteri]|uniref:Uncharacterized protein n=1 Tax=Cryomyces minteri TaxID=331657 RepID=A0A4U0VLH1_9PEZI|nr:hypothetical protein B0A49_12712 [Cryomyces minteri]